MLIDRPNAGLFVTGTDTEVGKTVGSAALLALLRHGGIDAVPMKPIQTGCTRVAGELSTPDLDFCLRTGRIEATSRERNWMCPYRFEPACSPHLAASVSEQTICLETIGHCHQYLSGAHDCVVAEGAGGVLVPIDEKRTNVDLMVFLDVPVVLVSRPGLGTLNHTLLSLRELRRAGLDVLGVLFCETTPTEWGTIERDNRHTIERRGQVRILGNVPYMPGLADGRVSPEEFLDIVSQSVTWDGT